MSATSDPRCVSTTSTRLSAGIHPRRSTVVRNFAARRKNFLLGLLREDLALVIRFLGPNSVTSEIRTEIERQITRSERISTSVEVPLIDECKKILNLAGEESERLAHQHIGTEHILLGILRVEGSLAARLLRERGLKLQAVRELLARLPALSASVHRQNQAEAQSKRWTVS